MNITTLEPVGSVIQTEVPNYALQGEIRQILDNYFKLGFCVIAICTNSVNILVFASIGFTDSVTIAFCGLAVSDMGFCLFTMLLQILVYLVRTKGMAPYLNLGSLAFIFNFYGFMFWDISISMTVFNALQKTACVVIPLKFKNVFTSKRALIIVSLIYLLVIGYYMPMLTMHWLSPKFDSARNRTRLSYTSRPYSMDLIKFMLIFNRIVVPFVAQVIVFICMAAMTIKLKQASNLRHSMTQEQEKLSDATEGKDDDKGKRKNFMSAKELRAVQSVNLVSAIFCICNFPDNVINFCDIYFPEFTDHGPYGNTFLLVHAVQNVLACGSAAANIVVYYNYNSKYRAKFLELCRVLLLNPKKTSS